MCFSFQLALVNSDPLETSHGEGIYTTKIGKCCKPGLAPFSSSQLLNIYQHATGYLSMWKILLRYFVKLLLFLSKYNLMNPKVGVYLFIIYFEFPRFLGMYLWVSINFSASCRRSRLKGSLYVRWNAICLCPFVYAKVLCRLTTLLSQGNILTLQVTDTLFFLTLLNFWLFSYIVHCMFYFHLYYLNNQEIWLKSSWKTLNT